MLGWRCHHKSTCTTKWSSNNGMGRSFHHHNPGCIQMCQGNCDSVYYCTGNIWNCQGISVIRWVGASTQSWLVYYQVVFNEVDGSELPPLSDDLFNCLWWDQKCCLPWSMMYIVIHIVLTHCTSSCLPALSPWLWMNTNSFLFNTVASQWLNLQHGGSAFSHVTCVATAGWSSVISHVESDFKATLWWFVLF